jgi:class 3 adenylate cyclase
MKPSREIRNVVLGLYHDVSTSVGPAGLLTNNEGATLIGTGPREFWVGKAAIEAVWKAQVEAIGTIQVMPGTIYAFEEGSVGWASDESTFILPDGRRLKTRNTFIFHREDGEWKLVHGHSSHETGNEEWGDPDLDLSMEAIAGFVQHDRPDLKPITSPEGTVTIVFTDMVASTATNEALGDDRFLPILLEHNEIVRERTRSAGGSVVKSQGDGFMLAFPSARRAVDCAIDVQRAVGEFDDPIQVRMGLHTGEPVRHADDFFGRDVAYAARLGAAATGGQILVSSLVKSLVEPSGSISFDGPREMDLKGFEGPQAVYAVVWSPQP